LVGRLKQRAVVIKLGGGRGIGELAASGRTWAGRLKLRALAVLNPRFVAVTRDLLPELAAYGLKGSPVVVIPNGVDTRRYHPVTDAEKGALRKALGWPAGLCFLYVGRFSPEKRLTQFIDVFAEARKEAGSGATLALIGSGPESARLRQIVQGAGLESWVRLHEGTDDVAGAFSAADIFILPSISEGLSNALLEAMSSGCAVLASKVGGTVEAVEDGASGLLFDPMDAKALKDHLMNLMKNPGIAVEMGRKARDAAEARFDVHGVTRRYEELYGFPGTAN
jgi:glycosyltransferase involved in cell wall biosynthesis